MVIFEQPWKSSIMTFLMHKSVFYFWEVPGGCWVGGVDSCSVLSCGMSGWWTAVVGSTIVWVGWTAADALSLG